MQEPEVKKRLLNGLSWEGNTPHSIVLHTLLGTVEGSLAWLKQISLSYNYIIGTDGTVYELVPPEQSAWHAGVVYEPIDRAKDFYGDTNPNKMSVGIAFERNGQKELTKAQRGSCAWLIKEIGRRVDYRYDWKNIFSHIDITSYKPPEVRKYREQVIETLQGEREPEGTKSTGDVKKELNKQYGILLTLLQKILGNMRV